MRAAFLPDTFARQEAAGGWELGRIALVLGLWCVGGLIVCNAILLATPEPALAISLRAVAGVFTGIGFVAGTDLIRSSGGAVGTYVSASPPPCPCCTRRATAATRRVRA
jgi:hypothetical protein